jgi:hypothetical protein
MFLLLHVLIDQYLNQYHTYTLIVSFIVQPDSRLMNTTALYILDLVYNHLINLFHFFILEFIVQKYYIPSAR